MEKTEKHIPVLDGIRGIAVAAVFLGHGIVELPFPDTFLGRGIREVFGTGWVGVDLFFVLSGFLITGILYDTRGSENYFRAFYARRFLRIFPLYYGVLFLLIVFSGPLQMAWGGRQYLYLAYVQNIGIAHHLTTQPLSPIIDISHFWTLAVEEQFYFLWPAVIFLLKDRVKIMRVAGVLVLCSIAVRIALIYLHRPYSEIYIFTPARADSLMVGALLALAFRSGAKAQARLARAAWFALPLSLAVLAGMAWPYHSLNRYSNGMASIGYTVLAVACAALMTLSLTNDGFRAVFSRPLLRALGKYSYGIYVLHYPIILLAIHLQMPSRLGGANPGFGIYLFVVSMAWMTTIVLAVLSFKFYESRFLRLKKYFRYSVPDYPTDAVLEPVAEA